MNSKGHLSILGGGIAGLSTGYFAKRLGIPFTIYEAENRIGGNAYTLGCQDFLFDSGAHRFHDKDPQATEEIKNLLGKSIKKINIPSQISQNGTFIDFPLTPLNLIMKLGLPVFTKCVFEIIFSRLNTKKQTEDFKSFVNRTYGKTISSRFLLNYSEKLWGLPGAQLSPAIAGKRMQGMDLKTLILERILGTNDKTKHLEGSFYYPEKGIGQIAEKLRNECGSENISMNSRITKILHDDSKIHAVEINGDRLIDTQKVVSTLPLNLFLKIMKPVCHEDILSLARSLRYRNMILVVFFLNKISVTKAATVYFPDSDIPFTRIYEPKNRSPFMSPPGKTSLVVEIPYEKENEPEEDEKKEMIETTLSKLVEIGWIKECEIVGSSDYVLKYAYPVLDLGYEKKISKIKAFLSRFNNLKLVGRNANFAYIWIHSIMRESQTKVKECLSR